MPFHAQAPRAFVAMVVLTALARAAIADDDRPLKLEISLAGQGASGWYVTDGEWKHCLAVVWPRESEKAPRLVYRSAGAEWRDVRTSPPVAKWLEALRRPGLLKPFREPSDSGTRSVLTNLFSRLGQVDSDARDALVVASIEAKTDVAFDAAIAANLTTGVGRVSVRTHATPLALCVLPALFEQPAPELWAAAASLSKLPSSARLVAIGPRGMAARCSDNRLRLWLQGPWATATATLLPVEGFSGAQAIDESAITRRMDSAKQALRIVATSLDEVCAGSVAATVKPTRQDPLLWLIVP